MLKCPGKQKILTSVLESYPTLKKEQREGYWYPKKLQSLEELSTSGNLSPREMKAWMSGNSELFIKDKEAEARLTDQGCCQTALSMLSSHINTNKSQGRTVRLL